MKLYYSPGACSLSPHIVLRELGVEFELVKTDLRAKKTENGDDSFKINPKGQVPALALDSGDLITEGVAITQYLADTYSDKGLAPSAPSVERAKLISVLNYIAAEYHKSFSPLFNPMASDEVKAYALGNVKLRLDYLEKELSDDREFIMGDKFTIADAYLFTITNWVNHVGLKLVDWPHLANYSKRIAGRPAVQAALKAEGLI